ncbi:hypothetical protein DPMN_137897 [Dreissena polymorpha]|uniref:Uncharacterized protein n=1 Tax=Dreissena polymorpha TaxID=45954 RepID=A0A9D4JGT3_DREPO|nr:hypothetical protein DPMN_137897 [Dreissena polymorpha]
MPPKEQHPQAQVPQRAPFDQDVITSAEYYFDNITREYLKSQSTVEVELSNLQERAHQLRAKTEKDRVLREDVYFVDLQGIGLIVVTAVRQMTQADACVREDWFDANGETQGNLRFWSHVRFPKRATGKDRAVQQRRRRHPRTETSISVRGWEAGDVSLLNVASCEQSNALFPGNGPKPVGTVVRDLAYFKQLPARTNCCGTGDLAGNYSGTDGAKMVHLGSLETGKMSCGGREEVVHTILSRAWSGNFGDRVDRIGSAKTWPIVIFLFLAEIRTESSLIDIRVELMTLLTISFLTMKTTSWRWKESSPLNHILCPFSVHVSPRFSDLLSESTMMPQW